MEKKNKLLGFRSGKLYKKIFSVSYIVVAALLSVVLIFTIESTLDALVAAEFAVSLFVPYVFLSDYKLRDCLPLFKKHKAGYSLLGMICVYLFINILFTLINPGFYQ